MKYRFMGLFLVILLALAAISTTFAEDSSTAMKANIFESINILGKGLAISTSDPLDFQGVRVGLARARIKDGNTTKLVRVGIFQTGGERYKIVDAKIENGSASGTITKNGSTVGQFSLTQFSKNDVNVWAGTLTLNGKSFNLYVLELAREANKDEVKEKISDYCQANQGEPNCRERMADFCKNNTDDSRCKQLFRLYCASHLDDQRCRDAIIDYCKENNQSSQCRDYEIDRTKAFCEKNPRAVLCVKTVAEIATFCNNNTDNGRCGEFCKKNPLRCKVMQKMEDARPNGTLRIINPKERMKLNASRIGNNLGDNESSNDDDSNDDDLGANVTVASTI